MIYLHQYASPLGKIIMAANGEKLTGLWFEGQKYFDTTIVEEGEEKQLPIFEQAGEWLNTYFQGKDPGFIPSVHLEGTAFRKQVWKILLTIPYGQTMTYGEIAGIIAQNRSLSRMAARAVGAAAGRNPISLIIPCHRIVGAGGSLTGYAGGIERKEKLLALEKVKEIRRDKRISL